ncbi:glycosyltransferase family 1 protein [Agrobacterium sp. ICMP 6402]|uniref:glycosyltransferase family 4 protein n=1 Tax=Agrobacterium sp. ICMP 6402 TaxID=2292443 RepID=UPI001295BF49|nr:glycosyltransferase family 4 protein [Agrobacterium sp. ICMP 6402]MQB12228.1 glycosyltransferase family 1 protein [Agrobacterium sp. ICMP 6402]
MKLAYFVLPHIGGTYSVFKHLRKGLAAYGIDVRWLGVCKETYGLPVDLQDEKAFGQLLRMPVNLSERDCAGQMAAAIEEGGFDGVIVNVLGDKLQTNIARYLPEGILRILVVHNISPGTYAAARAVRDYAHVTIGVSERCRADLVARNGFSKDRTYAIPNAVDSDAFRSQAVRRLNRGPELKALFVGRIEDASKGVMWLREILDASPEAVRLTIVGDGPDMGKLQRRLAGHGGRVSYAGAVQLSDIPVIMASHDVLIMPSRFEGLGMTMIEAMAGGCVPVVSHIRGVTDTIVETGRNGFLFPIGNYTAAANAIARLHADRDLLERMSIAGKEMVLNRFSIERMAARYNEVITGTLNDRPGLSTVLRMEDWSIPAGLRPGFRTYLPLPLKNWLRVVRERL